MKHTDVLLRTLTSLKSKHRQVIYSMHVCTKCAEILEAAHENRADGRVAETLRLRLLCSFMCSYSFFMIIFTETETSPFCLFYPRPSVTSPPSSRSWPGRRLPALPQCLPGGLAKIHRAACQNVDAKRTNVPLRSDFKRETCVWAQAEMMRWRGHADALSSPQIRIRMAEIRMSSIFWLWML